MDYVRNNWDALTKQLNITFTSEERKAEWYNIRTKILRFDTTAWRVLYSASFFGCLLLSNICLFPLSLAFSRIILREMVAAGRTFTSFALLITNLVLVSVISGFVLVFLEILSLPALWIVVPFLGPFLIYLTGVFFATIIVSTLIAWTFGATAIKTVVLIAFCPCIFALTVTAFTLVTLGLRNKIHTVVSAILLRCATKGPIVILGSILALIVALISALARWSTFSFR